MTKEEIQQIYDYSKSKIEIANKLQIKLNQNSTKIDNDILAYFSQIGIITREQISKVNLSKHWLEIQRREYELNPKCCEWCGKKLPFERRQYKCCNQSCAISLTNKQRGHKSKEEKQKISESLKNYNKLIGNNNSEQRIEYITKYYNNEISFNEVKNNHPELIKICKECGKEYVQKLRTNNKRISNSKFCSIECHNKNVSKYSYNLRKQEIQNGTFQGWQSRNILSYPEKFWKNVLDNNNIIYQTNYSIKQKDNYSSWFLDFYIEFNGRKIDLEIDGKQHKYKDRKESDKRRDEYIKSLGYEVYRIDWNQINNEKGKQLMKNKINQFFDYLEIPAADTCSASKKLRLNKLN